MHARFRSLWPIITLLCMGFFPLIVSATPVSNVQAVFRDGQIHVRWDPQAGSDVSYYNVYYGTKSILENGGTYDDFERTSAANTEFILTNIPSSPSVFIAVLPVDKNGKEMNAFTDEVMVDLQKESPPQDVSNLEAKSEPANNGSYLVVTAWSLPGDTSDIASIRVTPEWNGEKGAAQILQKDATFVRWKGMLPGTLRITVNTVSRSGVVSKGVTTSLTLKPFALGNGLAPSGAGVLTVFLMAGSIAGWASIRRHEQLS